MCYGDGHDPPPARSLMELSLGRCDGCSAGRHLERSFQVSRAIITSCSSHCSIHCKPTEASSISWTQGIRNVAHHLDDFSSYGSHPYRGSHSHHRRNSSFLHRCNIILAWPSQRSYGLGFICLNAPNSPLVRCVRLAEAVPVQTIDALWSRPGQGLASGRALRSPS